MTDERSRDVVEWLTSAQVAEQLPDVPMRTVQQWIRQGRFPGAVRLPSGQWRVPAKAVSEFWRNLNEN